MIDKPSIHHFFILWYFILLIVLSQVSFNRLSHLWWGRAILIITVLLTAFINTYAGIVVALVYLLLIHYQSLEAMQNPIPSLSHLFGGSTTPSSTTTDDEHPFSKVDIISSDLSRSAQNSREIPVVPAGTIPSSGVKTSPKPSPASSNTEGFAPFHSHSIHYHS